ncbi:MAG: hypothetical protein IMZ58_07110 [Thermoplasmata archaeon]|nr:hypothetical protein [Thermoplasmata archaeon]
MKQMNKQKDEKEVGKITGKMDCKNFVRKAEERYDYYDDPKTWFTKDPDGTVHPSENGWDMLPPQDKWEMCFEHVLKRDCNIPVNLIHAIAHQLWHSGTGKNLEKTYQELVIDRMWEKNEKLKEYIESVQDVDAFVYCKK